jgi:hypothetical protein
MYRGRRWLAFLCAAIAAIVAVLAMLLPVIQALGQRYPAR